MINTLLFHLYNISEILKSVASFFACHICKTFLVAMLQNIYKYIQCLRKSNKMHRMFCYLFAPTPHTLIFLTYLKSPLFVFEFHFSSKVQAYQ